MQARGTARGVTQNRSAALSLAVVATAFASVCLTNSYEIIDDAYITFRYARNLALHGQLVFNLGERVEGITNTLWALVLSPAALLRLPVEATAAVLSVLCLGFTLFRLWQLGPLLGATRFAGAAAALLLIFNPNFVSSTTNGLEAALFTALLAESVYRFARGQGKWALLTASLLFLTRPDGILFAILLLWLVVRPLGRTREAAVLSLYLLAPLLTFTALRLLYYHSAVPNSVIAKSFSPRLLPSLAGQIFLYFKGFFVQEPYLVLILLAAVLWLLYGRRWRDETAAAAVLCVSTILFSWAVALRNGGDWMPDYRLLNQYGVLYSILFITLIKTRVVSTYLAMALLAFPVTQTIFERADGRPRPPITASASGFWADTTQRLSTVATKRDRVSAEALGVISYKLADVSFEDPLGLTDVYIAEHGVPSPTFGKYDQAYLLGGVRPDVMVWHYAGHMYGVDQRLLDQYVTLVYGPLEDWNSDIVMIRKDRMSQLAPAFADWTRVTLRTNSIGLAIDPAAQ